MLHALQLDGRASFTRIAAVLGLSERAVSRRYHRLRSRLALRVVGLTRDESQNEEWFLRIMAPSGSSDGLMRALAERDDTSWVAVLAGDGGISCILRLPTEARDGATALERFRRSAGIATVSAQRLLTPVAGVGGWPGRLEALTPEEQDALRPDAPSKDETEQWPSPALSNSDIHLLRLLAVDGRMSSARLARATGVPETTVRRRIAELTNRGTLMFEVEIDPKLYGRNLDVICWMEIQPAALSTISQALRSHSEVAFASTTTGRTQILAILEFTDVGDLHQYLVERIGVLPGINSVHTEIVTRWIKRAGTLVVPPR